MGTGDGVGWAVACGLAWFLALDGDSGSRARIEESLSGVRKEESTRKSSSCGRLVRNLTWIVQLLVGQGEEKDEYVLL